MPVGLARGCGVESVNIRRTPIRRYKAPGYDALVMRVELGASMNSTIEAGGRTDARIVVNGDPGEPIRLLTH